MSQFKVDFANLNEFDALAQSVSARLACDMCLVNVVNEDTLTALGYASQTPGEAVRTVAARDMVCAQTVARGDVLRLADVRSDPEMQKVPAVSAFGIGAYLGVPIRIGEGRVVGAVCAISKTARIWHDDEVDYMRAVADLAESKLERHLLQYEHAALSAALAENDAILTTLAECRGQAVTIHNDAGELVFANSALHTDLRLSCQEMMVLPRAVQRLVDDGAWMGVVDVAVPGRPESSLRVEVCAAKNGLTLAEWHLAAAD
ncbi:MAG: GAF domain-containing protein [Pseudomonadota bacterium]